MIGVYTITNRLDGKMYVGSSNNIEGRISSHKSCLRNNNHKNAKLQNAVNKHDLINFDFEILEECELEHQFATECYWYNMLNPSYNLVGVNPNGGGSWSIEQKDAQRLNSGNRVRVMCTPVDSEDDRECYLFESQNQAAEIMFPELRKISSVQSISKVVQGKLKHYKGWHFKRWHND